MLRTRVWMGAILIALTVGVLVIDQRLAPWYPFLFLLLVGLAFAACWEFARLLPEPKPSYGVCFAGVLAITLANWTKAAGQDPWPWIAGVFAAVVLMAFLVEMATFQQPGQSVARIAQVVLIVAYLGLLPSFFAQLRWLPNRSAGAGITDLGTVALALAIFVPKCGDIGAYFIGRFFGKHAMAPVLSPKKTWEGAAGGMAAAIMATIGINRLGPVLIGGPAAEIGFGLTVGTAGLLGDLAESLVKRDSRHKDASQALPGFGGVLDVVDAIIFAGPVAFLWLKLIPPSFGNQ